MLSTNNRLLLYSLYKQATRGDAPLTYESRRMHLTFSSAVLEHGKWEAWNRVRGMSQQPAIQAYNSVAVEILSAGAPLSQPEVYIHVRRPGSQLTLVKSNLSASYRLPVVI
jgi:acyl-CoA-binding protein